MAWNEHVLNVRARLDKASKQEMLDSVRHVFTEGANIDFNNKENLRGLYDLADVMRKIFSAAGNTTIDFKEMIKLPGPDLFNGLKEAAKDFESVWNTVVANMGSYSLKDAFMEDASGISMALERITDKNGKIIKANVKDIQRAFKEISTSDQTKLFDSLEAAEKSIKGARTWEARTAAALEYVNVYERIIKLTDGNVAALDVERRLMPFAKESLNKDHKVAGMYSVDSLREAMPQMQTSLQNVFNMALGKPLIGLLEDGRINLEFAPVVIKQLDTGDLFKKPLKEPVKVSVVPVVETPDDGIGEIDEDFKAKLIEIQDALANARHRIARELKEGLLSNVPEDMKRGLEQQLDQVLSKTIVKDDDYNKLWEQFGPYVRTGIGTGTGDDSGTGDASSAEIESLRQQLEDANRRREEAELAERVAQENATAERHATEEAEERVEMYRRAMDSMQEEMADLRGQLADRDSDAGGGFALSDEEIENRLSKLDELKELMFHDGALNYDDPTSSHPEFEIERLIKIKELYSEITGEKDGPAIEAINRAIDEAESVLSDLKAYKEKLIEYDSFEGSARVHIRDQDLDLDQFQRYIPSETDFADDDTIRKHRLTSQIIEPLEDDLYETESLEEILDGNKCILVQLEKENLLTEEMRTKYDSINNAIAERIQYQKDYYVAEQAAEKSFNELDSLNDKISDTNDPDEANAYLEERKRILAEISPLVREDYGEAIEAEMQTNSLIEKRIALLREAQAGRIDVDDIDNIMKESGDLESKLERLQDVSGDWGSKVKDSELDEDEDALEALQQFEEAYDRIILKLANGRKIEILPDAKGLRALYKYYDGIDYGVYGETAIEDVEFVRKAIQQETSAISEQNEELKENANLKNQSGGTGAGQTDGAITEEVADLEKIRAKVAEITTAVEAKTTAFQNEKTAVDTVVNEEVKKLDELEEKVKSITVTISGLLNNIKNDESDLGKALNNVVVNVNYPNTEGDEQNKTGVEGLKTMLQDITYKVKLSKSDTDKNANKIALDESVLENTGGATNEIQSKVVSIESVLQTIRDKMPKGAKVSSAANKQTGSNISSTAFSLDKKETQKLALKKFRTELETTGRLTDDLKKKIRGLAISLGMVKDKEGFARWNEKFKQQKLSVGIDDLNAKEGRIYDAQAEAEAIKELIGLYEELGRAQALGDKNESSRLRGEIGSKRAGLTSVDYATDMKFKHAKDKGFNAASTKAENSALAEQAVTLKRLNALYQQYGVLVERAAFAEGYLKDELESQKKAKNDEILALSNSLDVITPEMLAGFDASFARGKKIESDKQYSALAKKMDADEETRLKNIAKLEKEIAILRADSDSATNDGVRNALNEEIKLREELIELQKQDLAMEAQDEAYYRKRLANDTKLAKSNAAASLKERRRVLNENEKEKEKAWKQQVKDIQREHGVNAADSMYKSANDSVIKTVGTQGVSEDIQAKAKELSKQNKALRNLRNEIAEKGAKAEQKDRDALSEQINKVKKLKAEVDGYLKIHEKYSGDNATQFNDVDTSGFGSVGSDQYWKNITTAIKGVTEGKATIKGLNADTGELTGTTKIAAHTFEEWSATVDPVTGKLSMLRTGIKKTETFIESVTRKTKEIFSYFSGSSIIFKAVNELKKGIQYVRDIDLALTELKKVTDETEETYRKFLDTASKTAAKVGSTIKDVVSSTADWARLGSILANTNIRPII